MVTRNPNNLITFGTSNYGAPVSHFTVDAGATVAAEVNPGEVMDFILRVVALKGTVIALGATASDGIFRIAIENNSWTAADLQVAIRALGATVGANNYDASAATVVDFAY